jgi:hypothetical protein
MIAIVAVPIEAVLRAVAVPTLGGSGTSVLLLPSRVDVTRVLRASSGKVVAVVTVTTEVLNWFSHVRILILGGSSDERHRILIRMMVRWMVIP